MFLTGSCLFQGMFVFVVDEVDVWVPAVVTAVKHDVISVTIVPTNQVSHLVIPRLLIININAFEASAF